MFPDNRNSRANTVLLFVVLGLLCLTGHAQRDYKGVVYDAKTMTTIPYVNIGVVGKGLGTVSDETGTFHLEIDREKFTSRDTLQISSLGYKTIKKAVTDLVLIFNQYPTILMHPERVQLNEVVLTDSGAFEIDEKVGYQNLGEKAFGYWKDNIALGGELATKIRVKRGLRKLNHLFFEIWANPSDSVLVRVNVYDDNGFRHGPGDNLNTSNQNILYTLKSNTRYALIDLDPFDIYVRDDFIVSLELLKVYGKEKIALILAAAESKYTSSYRKYASQSKWENLGASPMAYNLKTTLYSTIKQSNSKARKASKRLKKQSPISGIVLFAGRGIPNATITNYSTNDKSLTNERGRYTIAGKPGDLLGIEAAGKKKLLLKVLNKTTINVILETE